MKTSQLSLKRAFAVISALFVVVALITFAVGSVSYKLSRRTNEHTSRLTHRNLPALQALAKLEEATLKYNATNTEFVLAKDEAGMAAKAKTAAEWADHIEASLAQLTTLLDTPESRQLATTFQESLTGYKAAVARLQTALKAGDFEKAMATLDVDVAKARVAIDGNLTAINHYCFALSSAASGAATAAVDRNLEITLICTAVSGAVIVFACVFVQVIARRTSRRFAESLDTLGSGSDQVQTGARTLTAGSRSLAEGASEQAASLEETGASLTEMSSMTRRNSASAQSARTTAGTARETADRGAAQMQALQTAMNGIHGASMEITKILRTIDEIAFQTNILALNAAVEAARVGEAGLGFAVVADEVRNLAQRSAHAAKETALKIEDSVNKSQEGVRISAEVRLSFDAIQQQVRQLDTLVSEMATSSSEQSDGINQISTAVQQMDKVTQSTAANAEETAAAAEELNAQSVLLHAAVGQLRALVGVASASAAPAATKPATPTPPVGRPKDTRFHPVAKTSRPGRNGKRDPELQFA